MISLRNASHNQVNWPTCVVVKSGSKSGVDIRRDPWAHMGYSLHDVVFMVTCGRSQLPVVVDHLKRVVDQVFLYLGQRFMIGQNFDGFIIAVKVGKARSWLKHLLMAQMRKNTHLQNSARMPSFVAFYQDFALGFVHACK